MHAITAEHHLSDLTACWDISNRFLQGIQLSFTGPLDDVLRLPAAGRIPEVGTPERAACRTMSLRETETVS